MVTSAKTAAMKGPMFFLRENGAQYGGHRFILRSSLFFRAFWQAFVGRYERLKLPLIIREQKIFWSFSNDQS